MTNAQQQKKELLEHDRAYTAKMTAELIELNRIQKINQAKIFAMLEHIKRLYAKKRWTKGRIALWTVAAIWGVIYACWLPQYHMLTRGQPLASSLPTVSELRAKLNDVTQCELLGGFIPGCPVSAITNAVGQPHDVGLIGNREIWVYDASDGSVALDLDSLVLNRANWATGRVIATTRQDNNRWR